jgi:hypothetical protein
MATMNQICHTADFVDFAGTGLSAGQFAGQVAAHAAAGGALTALQGGKFGHGFISAGVSKALTPAIGDAIGKEGSAGYVARGTIVSAVVGGTTSALSGGKFGNGAATGAFQFLFNQVASGSDSGNPEIEPVESEQENPYFIKLVTKYADGSTNISEWSTEDSYQLSSITLRDGVVLASADIEDRLLGLSLRLRLEGHPFEMDVISGYRSQKKQDGLREAGNTRAARRSQHTYGQAADIKVNGMTTKELAKHAFTSGYFSRVNLYPGNAGVHVDMLGSSKVYFYDWKITKP